mmetsp:Transcript_44410/g.110572  ORF Transcript_44410/g.110572 Transcript_44410/m.110572 type:complete len:87 (+) Transcript_44410:370-630(+)
MLEGPSERQLMMEHEELGHHLDTLAKEPWENFTMSDQTRYSQSRQKTVLQLHADTNCPKDMHVLAKGLGLPGEKAHPTLFPDRQCR